jgi:hypothetical protein
MRLISKMAAESVELEFTGEAIADAPAGNVYRQHL